MTDPQQAGEGFSVVDRLRHRKVVQWGIAYGAGAWGLLQGLAYVSQTFDWPRHVQQLATIALLVGLPIALVLAWYHGDRGHQRVTRVEAAILAVLVLLGAGLLWRFHGDIEPAARTSRQAASVPAATAASAREEPRARPSIAVLPFENRSGEKDDAYFVDGIHDDILTQLSRVSALKVISRTSVERFRNTELPIGEIARELGVTSVLEGGVQRAGARVRINVQLIDARTDSHLWADIYDRELSAANIFSVQSEVAAAVAAALKTTLTPSEHERIQTIPTQNLQAWEAYQRGAQQLSKRTTAGLAEARRQFQAAIDTDPGFALAYVGLADATWLAAEYAGQPQAPAVERAEDLLGTALRLNPNLAEARVTLAKFAQDRRDFERAHALYGEAMALNPNYAQAHQWYAQLLSLEGRDEEAQRSLQRAIELDPMSTVLQAINGWSLSGLGRFDESLRAFERVRSLDPTSQLGYVGTGAVLAAGFGRLNDAVPYLEKAAELDPSAYSTIAVLGLIYIDLGFDAGLQRLLANPQANPAARSLLDAYRRLYAGQPANSTDGLDEVLAADRRNPYALRLLRDADLRDHEAGRARARYERSFPELFDPVATVVDSSNLGAAVDLALVLQATGERERATQLLDRCDALIAKTVRTGPYGYGILDAQVLALRGRPREALAALRTAADAGWRGPYWRYARDFDPAFASMRSEPAYQSVFADIERDMARQRAALPTQPNPSK